MMGLTRAATLLSLAVLGVAACSRSDDADAAREAALAASTLQAGALGPARKHIMAALAIRDDISDYWLLRAQIALARDNGREAFDAYRTVLALDRANITALRALCELGAQYGQPADLERFADALATLAPTDSLPVTTRGNAALKRGNVTAAGRLADQALAANPADDRALALKSLVLRSERRYAEAAELIVRASRTLGQTPELMTALSETYRAARDRPRYVQAIRALVRAAPQDVDAAFTLADLQYQDGDGDGARATVARIARMRPHDTAVAARLLDLWLKQGADALTMAQVAGDAAAVSLGIKAAYAQYANEMRRPDVAVATVGKVPGFATETLDAQAALAEARALSGDGAGARRIVDAILAVDGAHPRALIARSRLAFARADRRTAIADARAVVSQDAGNATARLLLARYLADSGETLLSDSALREGLKADPSAVRVAAMLVRALVARGNGAAAADVLNDVARAAPLDLRIQRLRADLCPETGSPVCRGPVRFVAL